MSSDLLPENFAPFHLVRLDVPRAECWGRSYDAGVLAGSLDFLRKHFPECEWGILSDGGLLDDTTIRRKPVSHLAHDLTPAPRPQLRLLRRAA